MSKKQTSRGKSKKRSLSSRKRAKDVSGATLDHIFEAKHVVSASMKSNWETALPRKMRMMMHAAAGGPFRKAHREDLPRVIIPKADKRANAAKAAKADAASPAGSAPVMPQVSAVPPSGPRPETAAAEAKRKRAEADALGAALASRRKTGASSAPKRAAESAAFGATNSQPPELKVSGRFGRIAAAATGASDRAKEISRQRVLESYAAAKAMKRSQ